MYYIEGAWRTYLQSPNTQYLLIILYICRAKRLEESSGCKVPRDNGETWENKKMYLMLLCKGVLSKVMSYMNGPKSHTLRKYTESTFVEPDPVHDDPRGQV